MIDDIESMFITDVRHYTRPNTTKCWPQPAPKDAPLYAPAVGTCNLEVLLEKLTEKFGADDKSTMEIAAVIRWLNDPSLHEPADVEVGDSTAMPGDTTTLEGNEFLREPTSEDSPVTVTMNLRTEEKQRKFRRRTVFHTHAANDGAKTFTKSMMRVNPILGRRQWMFRPLNVRVCQVPNRVRPPSDTDACTYLCFPWCRVRAEVRVRERRRPFPRGNVR